MGFFSQQIQYSIGNIRHLGEGDEEVGFSDNRGSL